MSETSQRKLGIADAMILMAGIALAIAWTRFIDNPYQNPRRIQRFDALI